MTLEALLGAAEDIYTVTVSNKISCNIHLFCISNLVQMSFG